MIVLTILALLTIVFLFALSSISQSHASARQGQAVIETARAAEIAGIGNLIAVLVLALLVIVIVGVGMPEGRYADRSRDQRQPVQG